MEVPEFAKRCIEDFGADQVVIKPLYHWFGLSEDLYWQKDILNPMHPYHKEYMEVLKHPIFKNEKVFFWEHIIFIQPYHIQHISIKSNWIW